MRSWARIAVVGVAFLLGLAASFRLQNVAVPAPVKGETTDARTPPRRYRYNRVICMSPAVSEIVFAVDAGDRVAGVSQHTKYPPEALRAPTCGGYPNPNYERILALAPDLVITQGEAEELRRFAETNNVEFVSLALSDLDSVFREITRVGELLQKQAHADLVCAEMRYRLARVRAQVNGRPPVGVLLVTGREQGTLNDISTVGPNTFLDDVLGVAGGRNVFEDLRFDYGVINKETLLARAPEVIVELHGEGGSRQRLEREVRRLWQGLAPLPAVRNGRVYVVESTYAMIPGPRVVELAERFAELFHGSAR